MDGQPELTLSEPPGLACVDLERLAATRTATVAPIRMAVTVTATAGAKLKLAVVLEGSGRRDLRTFLLRAQDCRHAALLLARVWDRFASDLPKPELNFPPLPPVQSSLRWSWPQREAWWIALAGSPGLGGGGVRAGARVGWTRGTFLGPGFSLCGGYDVIPAEDLGTGQFWLHGLWLGVGADLEGRVGSWPYYLNATVAGGASLAAGAGFQDGRLSLLPLLRARVEGRIGWPGNAATRTAPFLGLALEASPFDIRLTTAEGAAYREPPLRLELLVGLRWSWLQLR